MKISKNFNRPQHVPATASEKLNLRVTEATKKAIRNLSQQQKKSMSKVVLGMIDFYLNTIGIEEPNKKHLCW
jgi:predicted HicB family RNase H-like nuclease